MKTLCNIPATLFAAAVLMAGLCPATNNVHVSSLYLVDAGSYLSNDVAHVAIAKSNPQFPVDTEITVSARLISSNVWVQLSPPLTFAQFPHDYALADATNYALRVSSPSTFHVRSAAVTFPARCVRVTADPSVGAVTAPLIVEEWQAVDGGSGQLLLRINHRKLVIAPGQQVSLSWPISNCYVRLPPTGSFLWRSPCADGLARFGIFSASPDSLSISAGGRDAASASGVPEIAAPYPLPYGTSRPMGALAADGSALDTQLSRYVAASGTTISVAWTPVSASLSAAYVPLPSGCDLPTNVTIAVTADLDGNGTYTPGEPFGACHMQYADYAAPEVCLSRTNPSIMRVNLASAVTHNTHEAQTADCDRSVAGPITIDVPTTDAMPSPDQTVRVRIALSAINGRGAYNSTYANLIAFDRRINLSERPIIDETVLLDAGLYDLGAGDLATQAANLNISATTFTSASWRIILGDGLSSPTVTNNNLATGWINYYEESRSSATPVTPAGTVFRGFPQFKWRHRSTASFATGYPVWNVKVHTAATGGGVVYEQSFVSPCLDADGLHSATLPILPGALGTNGAAIAATNYWWSVSPCDAKFTTPDTSASRRQFRLE